MKKIIWLIILAVATIATIKYVPPISNFAREHLPETLLGMIGESPKGDFESGVEKLTAVWKELSN